MKQGFHRAMTDSRIYAVVVFALANASAGYGAHRVARRVFPDSAGAAPLAVFAVVYCATIVVLEAALGFAGALAPESVLVCAALAAVVIHAATGRAGKRTPPQTPGPPPSVRAGVPAQSTLRGMIPFPPSGAAHSCVAAALAALFALIAAWAFAAPPPAGGDAFIYHLFFPAAWLHSGKIEIVPLPFGAQAASYYPLNTELLFLWLMLPFHEDFLTNALQVPFLVLCGALVFELARSMCAERRDAPLIGAYVAVLIPAAVQQAVVARVDVVFSAWFLAAVLFLLEWRRSRELRRLCLAGIAFGLFLGTKSVAVLYGTLPAAVFLWSLRGAGLRRSLQYVLLFGVLSIASGGFWYVRNWVVTGNPFYPLRVGVAGFTVFSGAYGRDAMKIFHVTDPGEMLRILDFFLGYPLAVFLAGCGAISLVLVLRRGLEASRRVIPVLLLPPALAALFWYVNPHNNLTNGRFLFPAFFLSCVYPCVALDGLGRKGRGVLWAFAAAAVAASTLRHDHALRIAWEVMTTVAGANQGLLGPARGAVSLTAASVAVFFVFLWARAAFPLKSACAVLAGALLVPALLLSWDYHARYKYRWYTAFPVGRAWGLIDANAGAGARIAHCGNERAYGLFGTGLRNRVFYANVDEHADWNFHDYHLRVPGNLEPGADTERPQFHRERADFTAWLRNLRAGGADYLFCTTLDPIARRFMSHSPEGFTIEAQWASARPDVFREVFRSEEVRIFRVLEK
ncbi:MAG: hypothetical protein AB1742_16245 [bacterium]